MKYRKHTVRRTPQARLYRLTCCIAVALAVALWLLVIESRRSSPGVPTAPFSDDYTGPFRSDNTSFLLVGAKFEQSSGDMGSIKSASVPSLEPALGQVPPPQHLVDTQSEDLFVVQTHAGNITIKFRADKAPKHVEFMKTLIGRKAYDGMCWYRAEKGFVLQGGLRNAAGRVFNHGMQSPPLEYGLPNRRGFVNMARWEDPDSAGGDFCILLKDAPHLDRRGSSGYAAGFTVWAEVVEGMDVADRISIQPTKQVGGLNFLRDPVTFESVRLASGP